MVGAVPVQLIIILRRLTMLFLFCSDREILGEARDVAGSLLPRAMHHVYGYEVV